MIINITYPDKKTDRAIAKVIGQPFSFMDRFRMKGIGCSKLIIKEASPEIFHLISANRNTAYCNMELRQEGILVGFNSVMRIYAWCIPYYQLSMYYNSGKLSVFGNKHNIKLSAPFNGTIDKKFIKKVLKLKGESGGDSLYS